MNPYYQPSAAMQNPMSDRRKRMSDSSLPEIASDRTLAELGFIVV